MHDPGLVIMAFLILVLLYFACRIFISERAKKNQSPLDEDEMQLETTTLTSNNNKKSVIPYFLMAFGGYLGFVMAPVGYSFGSMGNPMGSGLRCFDLIAITKA